MLKKQKNPERQQDVSEHAKVSRTQVHNQTQIDTYIRDEEVPFKIVIKN